MKAFVMIPCILAAALAAGGCATRKYVRNTVAPVQAKVDSVDEQNRKQARAIDETRAELKEADERATNGISAAKERAMSAENRAGDALNRAGEAMNRANEAADASARNASEIRGLREVVANLDDYKLQSELTVPFKFNQYTLSTEAKKDLDELSSQVRAGKRYFIAVEGYTDRTGSAQYNEALSRRRADAVVRYLVTRHEIPIYRIHMIGLGAQKPADEGTGRAARARNRRVEVRVYSAGQATAASRPPSSAAHATAGGESARSASPRLPQQ